MFTLRLTVLLSCLLVWGCGCATPPPAPPPAPTAPPLPPPPMPVRGPSFDAPLLAQAPDVGFLYAASGGRDLVARLEQMIPAGAPPPSGSPPRSRPGAPTGWLKELRRRAGDEELFPEGMALLLGMPDGVSSEAEPALEMWLACRPGPALLRAVGEARQLGEAPGPRLQVRRRDGLLILSTVEAWAEAPPATERWVDAPRSEVDRDADGFLLISPERYRSGPLGAISRARSPAEARWLETWAGLSGPLVASIRAHRTGLLFEFETSLRTEHPLYPDVSALLEGGGGPIRAASLVPGVAPFFLALRGRPEVLASRLSPGEPSGNPAEVPPTSPFVRGEPAPAEANAGVDLVSGMSSWVRSQVAEALKDWGGPEVALAIRWDARIPEVALLVENRSPKRAALAVQRFQSGEVGARLRFVDSRAHDVPYRYTRLDGVDPRWLEPAFGFDERFLVLSSGRGLFEDMLEDGGSKIEEGAAFSALSARLGRAQSLALWIDPDLFPRLLAVGAALAAERPEGGAVPAAAGPEGTWLSVWAEAVPGLALGAGLVAPDRLRVVLSVETVEAESRQQPGSPGHEGVDSGSHGSTR